MCINIKPSPHECQRIHTRGTRNQVSTCTCITERLAHETLSVLFSLQENRLMAAKCAFAFNCTAAHPIMSRQIISYFSINIFPRNASIINNCMQMEKKPCGFVADERNQMYVMLSTCVCLRTLTAFKQLHVTEILPIKSHEVPPHWSPARQRKPQTHAAHHLRHRDRVDVECSNTFGKVVCECHFQSECWAQWNMLSSKLVCQYVELVALRTFDTSALCPVINDEIQNDRIPNFSHS